MSFSESDDMRRAFNRALKGWNRSAVIAELIRRAVANAHHHKPWIELFRLLTDRRRGRPAASNNDIREARVAGR